MIVKLGDVCTNASSNLMQKEVAAKNGPYPIYGAAGLIGNVDFFHQDKTYIAVVKDGAGIGRTMLLPAKSSVIGTMQYLIPNEKVIPEYLYYVVQHMHLEKYFTGATIPHIYFKDYKHERFNLSLIEEQKRIVKILSKAEFIISQRKQEIQKLDNLIKARFVEMFGDPLMEKNKTTYQFIGDVAESIDPQPSHRTPPIDENGIPYVSIKDCDYLTGTVDFIGARKVGINVLNEQKNRYTIHDGDLIIGKIGTIGNPIFIPARNDYTLSANVVLIQPDKNKISPFFLKYSLMSPFAYNQFAEAKNSTSQAAFGIQKVRMIRIMNPSLKEQYIFEAFAKQIDKSKFSKIA